MAAPSTDCDDDGWIVPTPEQVTEKSYKSQHCNFAVKYDRLDYLKVILERTGIGEAFINTTFAGYDPLKNSTAAHLIDNSAAKILAREYAKDPDGWLYLYGRNTASGLDPQAPGVGKTHLAMAILCHSVRRGLICTAISAPKFMDSLLPNRSKLDHNSQTLIDGITLRSEASLLVIDDFGNDAYSEFKAEKWFQIIDYRYQHRLPTVFTSNFELEVIGRRGPRMRLVVDRIMGMCRQKFKSTPEGYPRGVVEMKGASAR